MVAGLIYKVKYTTTLYAIVASNEVVSVNFDATLLIVLWTEETSQFVSGINVLGLGSEKTDKRYEIDM